MLDIFKKKNTSLETTDAPQVKHNTAPGTEIHFNPNLIDKLKSDHQVLLGIYSEVQAAFENSDFDLVKTKLKEFKSGFMDHILVENVSLYVYMKNSFCDDGESYDLVKSFRGEMDEIGKVVRAFLMKYETIGVDADLATTFGLDLADIGMALVARMEREEETLYPLYQSSY